MAPQGESERQQKAAIMKEILIKVKSMDASTPAPPINRFAPIPQVH
jgi:hypothetical protein